MVIAHAPYCEDTPVPAYLSVEYLNLFAEAGNYPKLDR
jgi:hypothetical protein